TTPLDTLPGVRMVYSDLGIIVMTQAIEGVYGHRIDTLFAERVAAPLGLASTRYLPPPTWLARIAPTEQDPWRGRMIRGEVHDENASRLDGVSGHAGLFSDAEDLLTFGEWLLRATAPAELRIPGKGDVAPAIGAGILHEFVRRQDLVPGSSRALGWDTPSGPSSSAGHLLSPESVGHTGFTGTSIWIDPTRDLVVVVLSNRVHPTRANNKWGELGVRGGVADRVVAALESGH
ncbi:MAG TPA: serine hydrolase, partial [Gemmatimonadales bacterium]|nr:serine hydrolase [Gemmatimonadales bacterium]